MCKEVRVMQPSGISHLFCWCSGLAPPAVLYCARLCAIQSASPSVEGAGELLPTLRLEVGLVSVMVCRGDSTFCFCSGCPHCWPLAHLKVRGPSAVRLLSRRLSESFANRLSFSWGASGAKCLESPLAISMPAVCSHKLWQAITSAARPYLGVTPISQSTCGPSCSRPPWIATTDHSAGNKDQQHKFAAESLLHTKNGT